MSRCVFSRMKREPRCWRVVQGQRLDLKPDVRTRTRPWNPTNLSQIIPHLSKNGVKMLYINPEWLFIFHNLLIYMDFPREVHRVFPFCNTLSHSLENKTFFPQDWLFSKYVSYIFTRGKLLSFVNLNKSMPEQLATRSVLSEMIGLVFKKKFYLS